MDERRLSVVSCLRLLVNTGSTKGAYAPSWQVLGSEFLSLWWPAAALRRFRPSSGITADLVTARQIGLRNGMLSHSQWQQQHGVQKPS
jgi:hypothetical protein